jgi:hypothetical protein
MGLLRKVITSNPSNTQAKEGFGPAKPEEGTVREALLNYGLNNPVYQGIVLEMPEPTAMPRTVGPQAEVLPADTGQFEKYFNLVSFMVASFGNTIRLPTNRALILLPGTKDRQLIGHRLAKTLQTNTLADFEAENPDQALSRIQPFL